MKSDELEIHRANAVETRAQKVKQNKTNTLVVPEAINQYTVENLVDLQSSDESLCYLKKKTIKNR